MDGVQRLISKNGIVDFVLILSTEGRLLKKHLVNQHTKCPPIYGTTVLLVQKNLLIVSGKNQE